MGHSDTCYWMQRPATTTTTRTTAGNNNSKQLQLGLGEARQTPAASEHLSSSLLPQKSSLNKYRFPKTVYRMGSEDDRTRFAYIHTPHLQGLLVALQRAQRVCPLGCLEQLLLGLGLPALGWFWFRFGFGETGCRESISHHQQHQLHPVTIHRVYYTNLSASSLSNAAVLALVTVSHCSHWSESSITGGGLPLPLYPLLHSQKMRSTPTTRGNTERTRRDSERVATESPRGSHQTAAERERGRL